MIRKEIEFEIYIWRGGEVVTLRSAKPTCAGSIPAHASRKLLQAVFAAWEQANCFACVGNRKTEHVALRQRVGVEST